MLCFECMLTRSPTYLRLKFRILSAIVCIAYKIGIYVIYTEKKHAQK